jgi:hypothetical protein
VEEAEEAVGVEMRDRRTRSHQRHWRVSFVFVGRRDGDGGRWWSARRFGRRYQRLQGVRQSVVVIHALVEETVVSPRRHLDVGVER